MLHDQVESVVAAMTRNGKHFQLMTSKPSFWVILVGSLLALSDCLTNDLALTSNIEMEVYRREGENQQMDDPAAAFHESIQLSKFSSTATINYVDETDVKPGKKYTYWFRLVSRKYVFIEYPYWALKPEDVWWTSVISIPSHSKKGESDRMNLFIQMNNGKNFSEHEGDSFTLRRRGGSIIYDGKFPNESEFDNTNDAYTFESNFSSDLGVKAEAGDELSIYYRTGIHNSQLKGIKVLDSAQKLTGIFQNERTRKADPYGDGIIYGIGLKLSNFRCEASELSAPINAEAPSELNTDYAPIILKDPEDEATTAGETSIFSVIVDGYNLRYEWFESSNNGLTHYPAPGSNESSSYSINNTTQEQDGNKYFCEISNSFGKTLSRVATLNVRASPQPPSITSHPKDVIVTEGQGVSFATTATGSTPLTYLWEISDNQGATWSSAPGNNDDSFYAISTVPLLSNGWLVRCRVKNSVSPAGVISQSAMLTVTNRPVAPTISIQPVSVSVQEGSNATFTVSANGTEPLTFLWLRSTDGGSDFWNVGGNSPTLTVKSVTLDHDGDIYKCWIRNDAGSVFSNEVDLTVSATPGPVKITSEPIDVSVVEGDSATFSLIATGTPPLKYSWEVSEDYGKNWNSIPGTNGPKYTILSVPLSADSRMYRCFVTGPGGGTFSRGAFLNVSERLSPPEVKSDPVDQTVNQGGYAIFSVVGGGQAPLSYQWKESTDGGETWKDLYAFISIDGQREDYEPNEPTFRILATSDRNGYLYRCGISNSDGSVLSRSAKLTVIPNPKPIIETDYPQIITTRGALLEAEVKSYDGNDTLRNGFVIAQRIYEDWRDYNYENYRELPVTTGVIGYYLNLDDLDSNEKYTFSAYSENTERRFYAGYYSFTTLPICITRSSSEIGATFATVSGAVDPGGGESIFQRGIVYGTQSYPTVEDDKVKLDDSRGPGEFSVELNDLTPGRRYYAMAFARNAGGYSYGKQIVFDTLPEAPQVTPRDGTYANIITVRMDGAPSDASIYYTIDGTLPTPRSNRYSSPFFLTEDTTVRAAVFKSETYVSELTERNFQIEVVPAGNPDVYFGESGFSLNDTTVLDGANAVAIQDNGQIVLAGYSYVDGRQAFGVARYHEYGDIDTEFDNWPNSYNYGLDNVLKIQFSPDVPAFATSIMVQSSDGKILVAGDSGKDVAIARLNADGSYDSSFGVSGKITLSLGEKVRRTGMVLGDDGCVFVGTSTATHLHLICFNSDGTVNNSFGSSGMASVETDIPYQFKALYKDSEGRFLIGGQGTDAKDFIVVRINEDGSIDGEFGASGELKFDLPYTGRNWVSVSNFTLTNDGGILVVGVVKNYLNRYEIALRKYAPDQSWDKVFAFNGETVSIGNFESLRAIDAHSLDDGKLLVTGYGDGKFTLFRFLPDGLADSSLGSDGAAVTDYSGFKESFSSILQENGKLVVATQHGDSDFNIGRFEMGVSEAVPRISLGRGGRSTAVWYRLTAEGSEINFGNLKVGGTGQIQLMVNNFGQLDLSDLNFSLSGADASEFKIAPVSFPHLLSPGASFEFDLLYEPEKVGMSNAVLSIASNDPEKPVILIQVKGNVLSNDAGLAEMTINGATINPAFTPEAHDYAALAQANSSSLTVTAVTSQEGATLSINGAKTISGQESSPIPIEVGATIIPITIKAEDGTENEYSISVTRLNASGIRPESSLDPGFNRDGIAQIQIGSLNSLADIEITEFDDIVVAGTKFGGAYSEIILAKLDSKGELLERFGVSGVTLEPVSHPQFGAGSFNAKSLGILNDGSLFVAGRYRSSYGGIVKFLENGEKDMLFSDDGVYYPIDTTDINDLVIDPENKGTFGGRFLLPDSSTINRSVLSQIDSDANIVSAFGIEGNGEPLPLDGISHILNALVRFGDGNIIAGGTYFDREDSVNKSLLVKYDANGILDNSFGTTGKGLTISDAEISKIALQGTKIITLGNGSLARFTTDGALDASFGSDGIIHNLGGTLRDVAVDPYGRILLVGDLDADEVLVQRRTPNGILDTSFGMNGVASFSFSETASEYASVVRIQEDGKILVGGRVDRSLLVFRLMGDASFTSLTAVLRDENDVTPQDANKRGRIEVSDLHSNELVADATLDEEGMKVFDGSEVEIGGAYRLQGTYVEPYGLDLQPSIWKIEDLSLTDSVTIKYLRRDLPYISTFELLRSDGTEILPSTVVDTGEELGWRATVMNPGESARIVSFGLWFDRFKSSPFDHSLTRESIAIPPRSSVSLNGSIRPTVVGTFSSVYTLNTENIGRTDAGAWREKAFITKVPIMIDIDETSATLPPGGGQKTINVDANSTWSWFADQDWIQSGEAVQQDGEQFFTYSVLGNPEVNKRTATVTFISGDISIQHLVTQSGKPPEIDLRDGETSQHQLSHDSMLPGGNISVAGQIFNKGVDASEPYSYSIYASVDESITKSDILLANGSLPKLGGRQSVIFSNPFLLPSDIASGEYYIGWIIDSGGDIAETDEGNNTVVIENKKLTILAPPTILVLSDASDAFSGAGGSGSLVVTSNSNWSWSIDEDWILTGEEGVQVGSQAFDFTVAPSDQENSRTATITFYSGAQIQVYVVKQQGTSLYYDLSVSSASNQRVAPSNQSQGDQIFFRSVIENIGTVDSPPFMVSFYASTDPVIGTDDALLGTASVDSIASSASRIVNSFMVVPDTLAQGVYYVGWVIDPMNQVAEERVGNNIYLVKDSKFTVTDQNGCLWSETFEDLNVAEFPQRWDSVEDFLGSKSVLGDDNTNTEGGARAMYIHPPDGLQVGVFSSGSFQRRTTLQRFTFDVCLEAGASSGSRSHAVSYAGASFEIFNVNSHMYEIRINGNDSEKIGPFTAGDWYRVQAELNLLSGTLVLTSHGKRVVGADFHPNFKDGFGSDVSIIAYENAVSGIRFDNFAIYNFEDDDHGTWNPNYDFPPALNFPLSSTILGGDDSVAGNVATINDTDVFRLSFEKGGIITIFTEGDGDPFGYLGYGSGEVIAQDSYSGSGNNFRIVETVQPGNYYILVGSYSNNTNYELRTSFEPFSVVITDYEEAFDKDGGDHTFTVDSNSTWRANVDADWVTITSVDSGSGTQLFSYHVDSNESLDSRAAAISFTFGSEAVFHSIVQTGVLPTVDLKDFEPGIHSITENQLFGGQSFTIHSEVENSGNTPSPPCSVNFYLSVDETVSSADISLGSVMLDSIGFGEVGQIDVEFLLSDSVPSGNYYLGWVIDSNGEVSESEEGNNTVLFRGPIVKVFKSPIVSSFTISGGAKTTISRSVVLNHTLGRGGDPPTHYRAGETLESLDGQPWIEYIPPLNFELSPGSGPKMVFLQFKNIAGISEAVDDEIILDLHQDFRAGATSLSLNSGSGSMTGWLDDSDIDYFSFVVPFPAHIRATTVSDLDTFARLFDMNGVIQNDSETDDDQGEGKNFEISEPLEAGSYYLEVTTKEANSSGGYELEIELISRVEYLADLMVGNVPRQDNMLGYEVYSGSFGQQLNRTSRKARPIRSFSFGRNASVLADKFHYRGSSGSRIFHVSYFKNGGNVTGEMTLGRLESDLLTAGAYDTITEIRVVPQRERLLRRITSRNGRLKRVYRRRAINVDLRMWSSRDEAASDSVRIRVKTK